MRRALLIAVCVARCQGLRPLVEVRQSEALREAEAAAARYGPRSAEARVAWSEVEAVRAIPSTETVRVRDCSLVDRIAASRSYAAWLRRTRNGIRRREASARLDLTALARVPLFELLGRPSPRADQPDTRTLAAQAAAATDQREAAVLYDHLEEVLAADNSVAARPSLEDDDSLDSEAALYLELALDLLETISWKAEQRGAFGNRRDCV